MCIQNRLLFCLISSVNDLDTIACPSVSSIGAIAMKFGMDIIVTYGTFSIILILVTTDVVGDNWCGRFGLWPFQFVAVPVCGRSGLWPFRFVTVSVCGRFGLWPFRFVAVSVCGRSGLWPFRFVAVSVVAISVCGRYDLLPKRFLCYRYFQDGLYRSPGDSLHKGPVMRNFMFLFRLTWTNSWFRAFLYDVKICACVCASVG